MSTLVTICNYNKYQQRTSDPGTTSGTTSGTTAGQRRGNNTKGRKKEEIQESPPIVPPEGGQAGTGFVLVDEAPAEEPALAKKRKRRVGTLFEEREITEAERRYAVEKLRCSSADVDMIWSNFTNHFTNGKGKNQAHVNWTRTWQNWVLNELKWGYAPQGRKDSLDIDDVMGQ